MMQTIELKTAPELKRIVLAAFPNYRKRSVFLSVFGDRGENINSYWDGGSRDEHAIVDLSTMRTKDLPTSTHPYFGVARQGLAGAEDPYVKIDHVGNVTLKAIPVGFVLVSAGTFCGKPATAKLHFHPDDMARWLPAPKVAATVAHVRNASNRPEVLSSLSGHALIVHSMINGIRVHPSLTIDRITDAVEAQLSTLENPGFCILCGLEHDGCEPDARNYKCENCGAMQVFGAEELLIRLAS